MIDLYDWRGFVLRTSNARAFWAVARKLLARGIGQLYVIKDGQAMGSAHDLESLNDLMS